MAEYNINSGVDKSIECFGLRSQYVFIVVGGILLLFIVISFLLAINIPILGTIIFAATSGLGLLYGAYWMNSHFGEYGLMKHLTKGYLPRHIINRQVIEKIVLKTRYY